MLEELSTALSFVGVAVASKLFFKDEGYFATGVQFWIRFVCRGSCSGIWEKRRWVSSFVVKCKS